MNIYQLKKYDYIDILRGIAVLGVIAVHSHQRIQNLSRPISWLFNYGQLGVQLFFVASALTLCLSTSKRNEDSFYNFYVRRLFRIAPLYYFGIFLYLCLGTLKLYLISNEVSLPPQYTPLAILSNLFFVHGFYEPGNNSVVPGGWSIATEMTFYLCFPFLYQYMSKLNNTECILYSVFVVGICFGIELLINLIFKINPDNTTLIYFNILNQMSVFLTGIITFRILNTLKFGKKELAIAILCTVLTFILLNGRYQSGFNGFFIPVLSAISFSILTVRLSRKNSFNHILWSWLKNLGKTSFSMYILHFLVLDFSIYILKITTFKDVEQPEVQLFIFYTFVVLVTYYLSMVTNRLIENAGIKFGRRFLKTNEA